MTKKKNKTLFAQKNTKKQPFGRSFRIIENAIKSIQELRNVIWSVFTLYMVIAVFHRSVHIPLARQSRGVKESQKERDRQTNKAK